MSDTSPPTTVDVAETLEELHQVTVVTELDTSGKDAGALGQVHPVGWAALGLIVLAVVFHLIGSDWLISNFAWWHWAGLILLVALSLRPGPIKALSRTIDRITDFFESGANSFDNPVAGLITVIAGFVIAGLLVGPFLGFADWIFGVEVVPDGSDFIVTSSSAGWVLSLIHI